VNRSTPPNSDELEVSIIGPGRGESVVLHLGNNDWCVVDSCIARGCRESVASEYLAGFGNGALNRVKLIVATHWHDDHIRGLASLMRQIPDAHFACSAALEAENFATLVAVAGSAIQGRSGVDEFKEIFDLLVDRAPAGKAKRLAAPILAVENRKLLYLEGAGRPFPVGVTALSPSDGTVRVAFTSIAQWLPKPGDAQRRITNPTPNQTSVVLWIEAGPARVLLGADLEHTSTPGEGWTAVLACHKDATAIVFKVPHHGSPSADCPEVWSKMLTENPVAVVTSFSSGKPLPGNSDLKRLAQRTKNLYCTAAGAGKPPSRDPLVEKKVRQVVSERRVIEGQPGHVRVRWQPNGRQLSPVVEMFNGAYQHRSPA
jgi:beta-lactamase superfamily II metal-dependent hydrolase